MKKRAFSFLVAAMALFVLNGCGDRTPKPPDEKQIAEDLSAENNCFFSSWIMSRKEIDTPEVMLPYEITSLTISKRDTREEDRWDTVWFDFTATNTIHEYTGSAYADYKLYSQGGWLLEDWNFEEYESHPAIAPRFEELMGAIGYLSVQNTPEDFEKSKYSIMNYCESAEEAATVFGSTYQQNIDNGLLPYNEPIAMWKYAGKSGDVYGLYTQTVNPIYVLGYSSDLYLESIDIQEEEFELYDPPGWYFYTLAVNESSTPSSPVTETRVYHGVNSQSAQSNIREITLTIDIQEGEPTAVEYIATRETDYRSDIILDILSVDYEDDARSAYTITGVPVYSNVYDIYLNSPGLNSDRAMGPKAKITVDRNKAKIDDYTDSVYVEGIPLTEFGSSDGNPSAQTNVGILPDSSTRLLTTADIQNLTPQEINYAKNEIYARHGRKFKSKELQDYFEAQDWYVGTTEPDQFDDGTLSDIERQNIIFLSNAEG